jgi:hypothetical protein
MASDGVPSASLISISEALTISLISADTVSPGLAPDPIAPALSCTTAAGLGCCALAPELATAGPQEMARAPSGASVDNGARTVPPPARVQEYVPTDAGTPANGLRPIAKYALAVHARRVMALRVVRTAACLPGRYQEDGGPVRRMGVREPSRRRPGLEAP